MQSSFVRIEEDVGFSNCVGCTNKKLIFGMFSQSFVAGSGKKDVIDRLK